MTQPKRLLFLSTPVGSLGSGLGGGVELTLSNLAKELQRRGYFITVVAPSNSVLKDIPIVAVAGELHTPAQNQARDASVLPPINSVLSNMLEFAQQVQHQFDLIINFAYDWLPFYLTPRFTCPVAHLVSMGSISDEMDSIITKIGQTYPGTVGVHTHCQAETFPEPDLFYCLGNAIDLELYHFNPAPSPDFIWIGRIAPEKGLEDALAASQAAGVSLKFFGQLVDHAYWRKICHSFPETVNGYGGFLPTPSLQVELGKSQALLMTPKWEEAFGNVVIEAFACGVPVITYNRGGPAKIVRHGQTGWVVESDNIPALAQAIGQVHKLDRALCRQVAEQNYSLTALGDCWEIWIEKILSSWLTTNRLLPNV